MQTKQKLYEVDRETRVLLGVVYDESSAGIVTPIEPPAPPIGHVAIFINGVWDVRKLEGDELVAHESVLEGVPQDEVQMLEILRTHALARVALFAKEVRAKIAGTDDPSEMAGWSNKLRIAQAILNGSAAKEEKRAFEIEVSLRGRGETLEAFSEKVLVNAARLSEAIGYIDGIKSATCKLLAQAVSEAEINSILDSALTTAKRALVTLNS